MSLPRYEKYKDSGIAWLGEVPSHWPVSSLKHIVACPITDGPHETPVFLDKGVPFVSAEAVSSGRIEFSKIRGFISEESHRTYSQKYKPQNGDIFMVKSGATTGVTAIVETDADFNIWSPLAAIRCGSTSVPRFVLNFMRSQNFQEAVTLNWSFGTQQNIGMGVIENLALPLPPIDEQQAIANFLDHETTKIDALIAEQQRLIELLREKRQAVISHAVTKGLNPHAPLKPSGIEWLGDVPEHWEVKSLKRLAENIKAGPFGSSLTKDMYVSSGYRVYGQEQVIPNDFNVGDYFITAEKYEELSQYRVAPRDILISCVGTFGKIAIVPDAVAPGIINPRLLRLRCSNAISAEYLAEVLRSLVTFEQFALLSRGGTMDVINIGTLNAILVAVPPIAEQNGIVGFLDTETAKFDALTAEADRGIELLQERRTALISAAVTGQIDVRGLVATEAA